MKVTSKQIAEICGVTRGTVDRALHNRPGIHAATRDKILKVAAELGYRPHFLAQSLVKGRTKTLGVILFDIHNRIFAQLYHSFEAEARKRGYVVYLVLSNKDKELEIQYINSLLDRQVDGIAITPVNFGTEFASLLAKAQAPVVTFGNRVSADIPFVWIDDRQAIAESVRHIYAKGYRSLIYVSPPLRLKGKQNIGTPEQRHLGLLDACGELGDLRANVVTDRDFVPAVVRALEETEGKPAVLCSSDVYALEIVREFKQRNIRVPGQAGVMGFDNIDTLQYVDPPLATVDYNVDEIGRLAAELLIRRIEGQVIPPRTNVPHRIVDRESL